MKNGFLTLLAVLAVGGCTSIQTLPLARGLDGGSAFDPVVIPHATRAALPSAVAARSFSGGRYLDLVVATWGDLSSPTLRGAVTEGSLAVVLGENRAGRRFVSTDEYYAGRGAGSLAVADFNGDGKLDVAVASVAGVSGSDLREQVQSAGSRQAGEIRFFYGRGDGTFAAGPVVPSPVPYPVNLTAVDLEGNGRTSLLMGSLSDSVRGIGLLRTGDDGRFDPSVVSVGTVNNSAIAAGRFRSPDKVDVAVIGLDGQRSPLLSILLNDGRGRFERSVGTMLKSDDAAAIVAADFAGEGRDQIAIGTSNGLYLYRVEVDATATIMRKLGGDFSAFYMAVGDLDGDGKLDLVVPFDFTTFSVLFGDGKGRFTRRADLRVSVSAPRTGVEPRAPSTEPPSEEPLALAIMRTTPAIADVDGDGRLDIIIPATPLRIATEFRQTNKLPSEASEIGGYVIIFLNRLRTR